MKKIFKTMVVMCFTAVMLTSCSDPLGLNKFRETEKSIDNDWENASYTVSSVEVTSGSQYLSASLSSDGSTINFTSKAEGQAKVKLTSSEFKKITGDLTVDVDKQGYPYIGAYVTDIKYAEGSLFSPWIDNPDANAAHTYDGNYTNDTINFKLKINGNIVYLIMKKSDSSKTYDSFVRGFYTLNDAKDAITITWKTAGNCWYSNTKLVGDEEWITDEQKAGTAATWSDTAWNARAFSVSASGDITINVGISGSPIDITFVKQAN